MQVRDINSRENFKKFIPPLYKNKKINFFIFFSVNYKRKTNP